MSKKMSIFVMAAIIILLVAGCSSSKEEKDSNNINFAIYLVKGMKTFDAINTVLKDIPIDDTPLLTDKDISEYVWIEHKIVLNKEKRVAKIIEEKIYMKVPTDGKPFVVVCNGERIYLGTFWTCLSSLSAPQCAWIVSDFKDSGYLKVDYIFKKGDRRSDKRVYEALKKANKLK